MSNFNFEEMSQFDLLGLALSDNRRNMVEGAINKYIQNEKYELTASSGSSVIILPEDRDFVIQVYFNDKTYEKIYFYKHAGYLPENVFVNILSFDEEHNAIMFEKIETVITSENLSGLSQGEQSTLKNDLSVEQQKKLYNDVSIHIDTLGSYCMTHGDLTLDNIGYSSKRDMYVLYDFDTLKYNLDETCDADSISFESSINFHIK